MNKYDDIIDLPHHKSNTRKHMSNYDRAAQFSPFAALTGYDDAVKETARLTAQEIELSQDETERLSNVLRRISQKIPSQPTLTVTYFLPDEKKEGGAYLTYCGKLKRIDEMGRTLRFIDGTILSFSHIIDLLEEE